MSSFRLAFETSSTRSTAHLRIDHNRCQYDDGGGDRQCADGGGEPAKVEQYDDGGGTVAAGARPAVWSIDDGDDGGGRQYDDDRGCGRRYGNDGGDL
eukprot:CAMPEP_0182544044 /NCGR_PEP_ID=MMETSP1323-20130603/32549_1 /TAXON_ID=236787 /ORGANISM="Florenciella parvula, Strain RCC1693" /LENGTH=96 /DNA_ID=CAMNT_0024755043 /DNA_START=417 /DNA_END=704 /DNA_ORIENTATION=-